MDTKQKIIAYAGANFDLPRSITVAELDMLDEVYDTIDSIIEQLTVFKTTHADCDIEIETDAPGYEESGKFSITAFRKETPSEVASRVESYVNYVKGKELLRRAEYEKMKAEFGNNE